MQFLLSSPANKGNCKELCEEEESLCLSVGSYWKLMLADSRLMLTCKITWKLLMPCSHELPDKSFICSVVWEHFILLKVFWFSQKPWALQGAGNYHANSTVFIEHLLVPDRESGTWKLLSYLSLIKHLQVDGFLLLRNGERLGEVTESAQGHIANKQWLIQDYSMSKDWTLSIARKSTVFRGKE